MSILKIQFFSDWHCGSGLSAGSDLDLLCIKDKDGLPYLPGKTLKGLIRDGAERLELEFVNSFFGQENSRSTDTKSASSFFSNAVLTHSLKTTLSKDNKLKAQCFRKISSTKIDEKGQAVEHSLRKMEVAVPLTLFAEIDGITQDNEGDFKKALQMVKRLGTKRNRGLGRCQLTLEGGE